MIDVSREKLLTPQQVAKLPAFVRCGSPVAVSTVWRWMQKGVLARRDGAARIRLENVRLPSGIRSSEEAVERFVAALNTNPTTAPAKTIAGDPLNVYPTIPNRAGDELDALGLK